MRSRLAVSLFAALITALPASPVLALSLPAPVQHYLDTLATVEQSAQPVSLEPLLAAAENAQTALMEVTGDDAFLESLGEADFAALQAQLRGFSLARGSDIYAQPQAGFFLALARAHGRPQDIAFFTLYDQTWGADGVPVYLMLRPQPSPCVRFGEQRIQPLYRGWHGYRKAHPAAYRAAATQQLKDLEEAVALGTCACKDIESVLAEQRGFLKAFPATPVAGQIRARMRQLKTDPEALPVNCR
jgi:hypothetical protein